MLVQILVSTPSSQAHGGRIMLIDGIGYPDFYPSRPGFNQPEDVLTEENVKNGFTAKTFVAPTVSQFR